MKTLYDLLGVPRQATLAELERAYRQQLDAHVRAGSLPLGRKSQRRMRVVREAFLLLAAPARRAQYDEQLVQRAQRRARLLRDGGTLLSAGLVVLGFALLGGAWYQQTDGARVADVARNSAAASAPSVAQRTQTSH